MRTTYQGLSNRQTSRGGALSHSHIITRMTNSHPYIFPTTPTTIHATPSYSTARPILPSTHTTIHNHHHQPRHLILIHPTTTLTYPIHNNYILHKTQHPTLQPALAFKAILLPAKYTSLHKSHIHKHKPSRAILRNTTLPPTRTTNITTIQHTQQS